MATPDKRYGQTVSGSTVPGQIYHATVAQKIPNFTHMITTNQEMKAIQVAVTMSQKIGATHDTQ